MAQILLILIFCFLTPIQALYSSDFDSIMHIQIRKSIKIAKNSDKSYYRKGIIIIKGDSIHCDIYIKNKNQNGFDKTMYSFIIVRLLNDSIIAYTAEQVEGFIVNGNYFKQHCSDILGKPRYYFIRLLINGNICLYYRSGYLLDKSLKYYILFRQADHFIVIDPLFQNLLKESDNGGRILDIDAGVINIKTQRINDKFKTYFSQMLSDCESIKNKILSEFYTMNDIETIIKEYNNCK